MPDDLHEIEQRFLKALEEHVKELSPEDEKQQPNNTCLPAVIAAVL